MSSQVQKFKIGLFVVVSLALAIVITIWLGASRFLEVSQTAVAYFSESVQGLETAGPVKFRGVPVGRVKSIRLAPDGRLIEVVLSLNKNFEITEGLGIKINMLGLTGLKYLEMDNFRPDQMKEPIELSFKPEYPVIATYPSDIREIGNALEAIFQKIKDVDVGNISLNLLRVTAKLDKILSDPGFDTLGTEIASTVSEMKDGARKLNQEISRVQRTRAITRNLDKTSELLAESTETVRSANRLISRTDNNINRLSRKLEISADNIVDLTRQWKKNPVRAFIWGTDSEKPR
ncbi:MAG: MlaD family protein [Desulfomonilaceae bacterium]|nr:MlaD family protein [Desulfomonilaceae bacterium]